MYEQVLKQVFGEGASFREGQDTAINQIMQKKRMLVVQKTGWGKSLVYFLATKLLRQVGEGATLIISPLLALTRNQIESTNKYGIVAECINSQTNKKPAERAAAVARCNNRETDVLFITPEQLSDEDFVQLLSRLKVGLLVVDEAHCISNWGHDFRPDYRRIQQLIQYLPKNVAILATTATANDRVISDIADQLGDCKVVRGELQRESLYLHKMHLPTSEEKYAWLVKNINSVEGSGIVYATTVSECNRLAKWLRYNAIDASAYHSSLKENEKMDLENRLINNEIKVLVSTVALGMGFDKEDIHFVYHYYTPQSVIEHYQQIGRAGRGIDQAVCVLLYGGEDERRINEYFIYHSFPKQKEIFQVIEYIEHHGEVKSATIAQNINIHSTSLDRILKLLALDGILSKEGSNYSRTLKEYRSKQDYYNEIIQVKLDEYQQLLDFQKTEECQMAYLTKVLDAPISTPCGKCSTCLGEEWNLTEDQLNKSELDKVRGFFSQYYLPIQPRKQSSQTKKNLRYTHDEGLALSNYHEALGQLASQGKYADGVISDVLVKVSAEKLKGFMKKKGKDINSFVIVPIPSNRRPLLVPEFAQRLASELQCQYVEVFSKRANEPEQKSLLNNQQQETNIREYLYIHFDGNLDNQQILLVDDFVDSRWTFAIAAEKLAELFSAVTVTPFALANTKSKE